MHAELYAAQRLEDAQARRFRDAEPRRLALLTPLQPIEFASYKTFSVRFAGSISTCAPWGMAAVMSSSNPAIIGISPSAAPCTRIGFTVLKTIASGTLS